MGTNKKSQVVITAFNKLLKDSEDIFKKNNIIFKGFSFHSIDLNDVMTQFMSAQCSFHDR